ncbi:TPA: hypothetical protein SMP78_003835 [Proteus mirabilis]
MKNPKLISKPFAQNGQKNVIPEKYETSMESNQATWDQGFGQITMLPVSAGGLPPKGQDFNGILNQMCETIVHISKGGVFKFSTDYATAINGYPKGAILQSEDEKKYYQSLIDNNKVNFNTASQDQIKTSWKLVMTDDVLDQLSKKLESTAIVQSTGSSTTSVMSQKASVDAFQPKGNYQPAGNYALKGESYTKSEENNLLGGKLDKSGGTIKELTIANGDYSSLRLKGINDTVTIERKPNDREQLLQIYTRDDSGNEISSSVTFPRVKDAVAAYKGESYTKIASDERYQLKGNYQVAGYSYSKSEVDNKFQPKGNYATTSEMNVELNKKVDKASISQQLSNDVNKVPSLDLVTKELGKKQASGNYALNGESYTKPESDAKYQPKGNYGAKNTASKASSGWLKCGDTGVIYQWGDAKGCITADQTRNFPIAFPNACVQIVACYANFDDYGMGVAAIPINNSSFVVTARNHAGYAGDGVVRYIAVGY